LATLSLSVPLKKSFGDLLHFATSNVRFDKKAVQTLFCSESQVP
jgi:hypothetical protein